MLKSVVAGLLTKVGLWPLLLLDYEYTPDQKNTPWRGRAVSGALPAYVGTGRFSVHVY